MALSTWNTVLQQQAQGIHNTLAALQAGNRGALAILAQATAPINRQGRREAWEGNTTAATPPSAASQTGLSQRGRPRVVQPMMYCSSLAEALSTSISHSSPARNGTAHSRQRSSSHKSLTASPSASCGAILELDRQLPLTG